MASSVSKTRPILTVFFPVIGLLILTLLLFMNCWGGVSVNHAEDTIGPSGGTFTDEESDVEISVPAGALSSETQLTCTYYEGEDDFPDTMKSMFFGELGLVDLGPDGLEFDSPVTITVPVSADLTPGDQFPLFVWNTADQSWEQTESLCTVNADGHSYSAQVTHFSMYTASQLNGIDGIFGNLDPSSWQDVESAFINWQVSSGLIIYADAKKRKQMRDCCMELTGIRNTIDYRGAVDFEDAHETGDISNSDYVEKYEVTRGGGDDFYLHLTSTLYWRCVNPNAITVQSEVSSINMDTDTNLSTTVRVYSLCESCSMPGVRVDFFLSGPGSITPESTVTGADGLAYTTYTASEKGTAVISANLVSCQQWDQSHILSSSTSIEVIKKDWELYIEMSFSHNPENWDFYDDIAMYIPFKISDTGVISSPGGEGSHSAVLLNLPDDCIITHEYAPDFVPGVSGNKTGSTIYLTVAPISGWALEYTLMCDIDDKPVEVWLPPYEALLQSIMVMQVFNEYPAILEENWFASGSGQDTMWATDNPIEYTYYITVNSN